MSQGNLALASSCAGAKGVGRRAEFASPKPMIRVRANFMNVHHGSNRLGEMPKTIGDVVTPWAERSPDHPALIETAGSWTYGQLAAAISVAKKRLHELGVRPGDRGMIVGENCRSFVALLLATAGLDAWPVLANARLSAREIDEIRQHSGVRRVFYTTAESAYATEHATRDGAALEERDGLGSIGVGALNAS